MIILLIGTYGEVIGYGARIDGVYNGGSFGPFLVMNLFIILAPVAFAAANYVIFGRLLRIVLAYASMEKHRRKLSFLPVNKITAIFVTSDVISFLIQGGGAGLLLSRQSNGAPNLQNQKTGEQILTAGLCINLISFCFFFAVIIYFSVGFRKLLKQQQLSLDFLPAHNKRRTITPIIVAMFVSMLLIIVRSAYRIIEFHDGWNSRINSTESYFYIFDASLMVIATGIYVFIFPYKYGVYGKKKTEKLIRALHVEMIGIDRPSE